MKDIIVKLLLVALALASLSVIAIPAVWQDGKSTKSRVESHYLNMFQ